MLIAKGVRLNGVGVQKEAECCLQNIHNMSEIMVWYKAVVGSPAGDDELCELVWQNSGQNCIKAMGTHMTCMLWKRTKKKQVSLTHLEEYAIAPIQALTEHD